MESLDTLDTKESERDQRKADPKSKERSKGGRQETPLDIDKGRPKNSDNNQSLVERKEPLASCFLQKEVMKLTGWCEL